MEQSQILSVKEKIGYSLGDLAANLVFQTLITYLAYFYTDIYGLSIEDSSYIILTVGLVSAFTFNPLVAFNFGVGLISVSKVTFSISVGLKFLKTASINYQQILVIMIHWFYPLILKYHRV